MWLIFDVSQKMRLLILLLIAVFSGCVSSRVAGRYRAQSGEILAITDKGSVSLFSSGHEKWLGEIQDGRDLIDFVTPGRHLTVPLGPPHGLGSPGLFPILSFSANRKAVAVDWRAGHPDSRPREFVRE
jgi:hypothetical protein